MVVLIAVAFIREILLFEGTTRQKSSGREDAQSRAAGCRIRRQQARPTLKRIAPALRGLPPGERAPKTNPLPTRSGADKPLWPPPKPRGFPHHFSATVTDSAPQGRCRLDLWDVRIHCVPTPVRGSLRTLGAVMAPRVETWHEARRQDKTQRTERPHKQMVSRTTVSLPSSLDVRFIGDGTQFERRR